MSNYFGKLADNFCRNAPQNETWLNVYGSVYRNLVVIDVDENENLSELNKIVGGILNNRLLDLDIECDSEEILVGLQTLHKTLSTGEYPKIEVAIAIFSILKNGMDKSVDPMLITKAYQLSSELLHILPPSKGDFREYWKTVFLALIGDEEKDGEKLLKVQMMFTTTLAKVAAAQKKGENQQRAANAYLGILCELLEIDFACFLSKHSRNANALLNGKNVPLISSLFWPHKMIQINSNTQGALLNPIIKVLRLDKSKENSGTYGVCCRLLAMIFELIRLTSKCGTAETVDCAKTPTTLRRLFTDILTDKDILELVHASVPFGWVKRAVQERQQEIE